jgi:hypothetical protein
MHPVKLGGDKHLSRSVAETIFIILLKRDKLLVGERK